MPPKQSLGLDEVPTPVIPRQQPIQPPEQRSIAWLHERAGPLATQHRRLVAKNHDLDGEVVTVRSAQPKQLEQSDECQVEERQGHGAV